MKNVCFSPFCIFIFLISLQSFSQHTLTGSLKDQNRNPVVFANVVLLESDSTTVYRGAVSNEQGNFRFEEVFDNEYVLAVSFIGYERALQRIKVNSDTNLGTIVLKEDAGTLDEVRINARKPTITRSIDRITFDVENSTLSSGNSWDILRKTPGVIEAQGQLQVRNGAVTVYINDRRVQLTAAELRTLLESYSAENIKSIEVITNPPARYDAEGGAILNINTTRTLTPGYKGSVEGAYTQAIFPKYRIGTSHYFKTEKLNVFANYNFSPRKDYKKDESHINFMDNGNIFSLWDTDFRRTTRSQAHNANLMLDYSFDDRNTIRFSSNVMLSPNRTFDNNVRTTVRNAANQIDSTFSTTSHLENDENNIALDLSYIHQFTGGSEISTSFHYTRFDQERTQDVNTRYFNAVGDPINNIAFNTFASQDIDIFTAQVDYVSTIGGATFETGGKVSTIDSGSGIEFFDAESLNDLYDNLEDQFLYDERIYALYASITRDWDNWSLKAGLRGEYTDIQGESQSLARPNTREYFELFPTAYLQHTINENHSLTLDYSRRIQRPRYESLNPFRYFLNETNYNAGNPNLRAAISNNFNLSYALQGQYFFDVFYNDLGRSTATLAFQDNEDLTIRNVSTNLLSNKSYGISLTHGRSINNFWYLQVYSSLFHDENRFLAVESGNQEVQNEVDAFLGQLYNAFTLSSDGTFSGNLTLTHVSDYISGSYNFDPMTTLSIGLRKTLWDNRAELTLNFEDILDETNTRLTSRYLNQDNSFYAWEELRHVRVGFKYNFGNFRLRDNQRSIDAAERERL